MSKMSFIRSFFSRDPSEVVGRQPPTDVLFTIIKIGNIVRNGSWEKSSIMVELQFLHLNITLILSSGFNICITSSFYILVLYPML